MATGTGCDFTAPTSIEELWARMEQMQSLQALEDAELIQQQEAAQQEVILNI